MFVVVACICFGFLSGGVSGQKDYALQFPAQGTTDYANIWGMRSLTRFTVCLWMKTTTGQGTPFSYAPTNSKNNELLLFRPGNFLLFVNNQNVEMGVVANDGKWHHICATWRNSDGQWKSYKDGQLAKTGTGLKTGYTIQADGSLVLGQEQDTVGGGFEKSQSFKGMLTNVNVWSYVLPEPAITEMSKCCLAGEGNVYMWSDFGNAIKGNTRLVIPARCPCTL